MYEQASSRSPASEIAHFLNAGFLLFKVDDLKLWNDPAKLDAYLQNIATVQRKIKHFFELDRDNKQLFQAENSDFNHESKAYFPGWWDEFSYDDRKAHTNYSPEYLMSNNYYAHDDATLFAAPGVEIKDTREQIASEHTFPNREGYELCTFFHNNILTRVQEELSAEIGSNLPKINTLQCVMIYYDQDKILSKHTDEVFLSAHIGPTDEGLLVFPPGSEQPIPVTLETGEILLFFGREFTHELSLLDQEMPNPLPHYAEAKKGRLTMALSTFVQSHR